MNSDSIEDLIYGLIWIATGVVALLFLLKKLPTFMQQAINNIRPSLPNIVWIFVAMVFLLQGIYTVVKVLLVTS